MKVLRGPQSSYSWQSTDERRVREYIRTWSPGKPIRFDGTIDKSGTRHTDLGVEINEQDVLALHGALIKYYRETLKEQVAIAKQERKEQEELQATIARLESVFGRIADLTENERHLAPSLDELLLAVKEIAEHYSYSWTRNDRFKSRFSWLKWRSL